MSTYMGLVSFRDNGLQLRQFYWRQLQADRYAFARINVSFWRQESFLGLPFWRQSVMF